MTSFLEAPRPYTSQPPALPAIVSNVHTLGISLFPDTEMYEESYGFVALLGCFTLRQARTLVLQSEHGRDPIGWSQSAFLAFSARSSLHATLRSLEISGVMISAEQLLACLSTLPSLESLSISDPCPMSYGYIEGYGYNRALVMFPHCPQGKQLSRFRLLPPLNTDGPFQSSILYYQRATVDPVLAEAWPRASKLDPNDLSAPLGREDDWDGDWANQPQLGLWPQAPHVPPAFTSSRIRILMHILPVFHEIIELNPLPIQSFSSNFFDPPRVHSAFTSGAVYDFTTIFDVAT
ncbi:hypothetical protein MSAN_02197600 [Mycena sanguinolenta]|uniref:Uncharacterized protein n=1 Tax=Mycena sanguinolenta TaxID=230812 RepID=A0A8H6XDV9_9AGAR|nr:hypothetical protein MSAN_02197600 [Mycena sanguinolenta]